MKLIVKLLSLITIAALPSLLLAQTNISAPVNMPWSLIPIWPNAAFLTVSAHNSSGGPLSEGRSTGLIKTADNSVISNVQIDANNYGVVRLNSDLNTQWLTNIGGYPLSIGMFKGSVLVIAATERIGNATSNKYIGYMIDQNTGKIITQTTVYEGDEKYYLQAIFLYAPDGSSFKMAVRTTNLARNKIKMEIPFVKYDLAPDYFSNNDVQLLEFDTQLNIKSTIKPVLPEGYFLGGTTNVNGDVFLMTDHSQGFIKIARYENGKTTAARVVQLPVSFGDNVIQSLKDSYLLTSATDPSVLFFAATYPAGHLYRELLVSKFNFKSGAATSDVQVMDKDYFKNLERSYIPFSKKFDDARMGSTSDVRIRNMIENDGKLIVGLSSYNNVSAMDNPSRDIGAVAWALLINIYDDKSALHFQQVIPRGYSSAYPPAMGMGLHCRNNILYIVANNNNGFLAHKMLFAQIDLNAGTVINITGIEKNDVKSVYATDPEATIWFDKKMVVSYLQEKGLQDKSADAHLQLLNY